MADPGLCGSGSPAGGGQPMRSTCSSRRRRASLLVMGWEWCTRHAVRRVTLAWPRMVPIPGLAATTVVAELRHGGRQSYFPGKAVFDDRIERLRAARPQADRVNEVHAARRSCEDPGAPLFRDIIANAARPNSPHPISDQNV